MVTRFYCRWILPVVLAIGVLGASTVVAGGAVGITLAPQNLPGVEVQVTSACDGFPMHGFMPVHVRLKNDSGRTRSFQLDTTSKSNSHGSVLEAGASIAVSCPPGAEVERDILVPVVPTLTDSNYRSGQIRGRLGGSSVVAPSYFDSRQATPQWPAIAIGSQLANRNLEDLKKKAEKRNSLAGGFGVVIQAGKLPADWRALGGFDVLLLASSEWTGLGVRQRAAVDDWIRLGGTLDLHATDSSTTLDELGFQSTAKSGDDMLREFGLGRVRLFALEGEIIDSEAVCREMTRTAVRNRGKELNADFKSNWQLSKEMPPRRFRGPGWVFLLIVFGILMGPINLFVLAGKQRRHRLFVTTPVIALVSSLLLGLFILILDGIGGRGCRFAVLELQPGKGGRKVYVNQQSLISTGLLTSSSFVEEHPTMHLQAALARSRWAAISGTRGEYGRFGVSENGRYRGDWLRSRSRHGFVSQSVVPSRARFELAGSAAEPALVSGLGFPTGKVFYLAMDGSFWRSANPTSSTGERLALVRSNRRELEEWRDGEATAAASEALRRDLRELPLRRGYFYAAAGETGMELDFLDSIRWEKNSTFLFGRVVSGGENEEAGGEQNG